jgi:hypothetical protein
METLDIAFAEIKKSLPLLQTEMNFGAFKIESGHKFTLDIENIAVPDKSKTYGFFGKIEPKYKGVYL